MDYENAKPQEKQKEFEIPGTEEKGKRPRFPMWKVILFLIIAVYFVFTLYRVPLLIKLGNYLIVEQEAQKADLIVCIAGEDAVRAPAVIDAFNKGLAPYIYRAKKVEPDGFDYIKKRMKDYPDGYDMFISILKGFGIPEKVILSTDKRVENITEEAMEVRKLALDKGFKSIIVVTSPINSRRAWVTFQKVFKNDDIKIISLPSPYQSFNPKDWWNSPRWIKELIFEYQRLIYLKIAFLM